MPDDIARVFADAEEEITLRAARDNVTLEQARRSYWHKAKFRVRNGAVEHKDPDGEAQ